MPLYKVGVAGPVVLEDGRTVTAEETFWLTIGENNVQDQDLEDRCIIIQVEPQPDMPDPSAPKEPTAEGDDEKKGEE